MWLGINWIVLDVLGILFGVAGIDASRARKRVVRRHIIALRVQSSSLWLGSDRIVLHELGVLLGVVRVTVAIACERVVRRHIIALGV